VEFWLASFSYKGVDRSGHSVSGTIESPDRRSAIAALASQGKFASEMKVSSAEKTDGGGEFISFEAFKSLFSRKPSSSDVLAFTSQLSTALRAGLDLLSGLNIIAAQQKKECMRKLLVELAGSVSSGASLSDALGQRREVFSDLYISMVRVGETAGILDKTTTQLAALLERDEKIKSNLMNASVYPLFVLAVGLISVVVVITVIIPGIISTIGTSVDVMPLPTRILMGVSGFLKTFGPGLAVLGVGGFILFRRGLRRADGRYRWDSFKLRVPVLGNVLRSIAVGRFARTLGALAHSGVTILESLKVVRDTLGNEVLARQIDDVTEKVRTGHPLAEPLEASGEFPALLVQIVSIGEQTGRLDELLLTAAETFDEQADAAVTRFMSIFPAFLILGLAVVIGFIIAATILPIVVMEISAGGM
jgi:type II secretory pathway component PulF